MDSIENSALLPENDQVNVLIVDDRPENLMAYQLSLQELNQNLVTASSGEEALRLVLQQEFAVILLDVNMPGIDGFETATLIRQRKKSARTPIIFLSAFTDEIRKAQGYASGAVDYLPTPVVPEILQAKIRVFIELFQMRRQSARQAALQAEERAKRNAAEESDRRKDEFLGMLAHELRNPLGPILNAAQLLRRLAKEPNIVQLSDIVERQVKHMTRLIDDLLDATRLARGMVTLQKRRCDLSALVRQTAQDYSGILDTFNLSMHIEIPDTPIWVECDSTRIVQAISNLLHNAKKFTNPGGVIAVKLESDKANDTASITISDTGIGIEPKMLPVIFDVFRQAEQGLDRSRGGLGLGLALVKGLVELHGGRVLVDSPGLGQGSRFSILLPMEEVQVETDVPEPELSTVSDVKRRILVIEDNQDSAETAMLSLSEDGYEVQTAYSGVAGLELARSFRPQIVLCDIGLPGMDGYQVVRKIRQDTELADSYVIALTGYGRDSDQRQAFEAGFDLHLTKPIDYNHLRQTLAHLPARH